MTRLNAQTCGFFILKMVHRQKKKTTYPIKETYWSISIIYKTPDKDNQTE